MKVDDQLATIVSFCFASTVLFLYLRKIQSYGQVKSALPGPLIPLAELPSLRLAFDLYNNQCVCGKQFPNNCAHFLSDALIRAGYKINDLPNKSKFARCTQGRVIRAKELLVWAKIKCKEKKGSFVTDHTKLRSGFWFVYQERNSDKQGHVCLHDETCTNSKPEYSFKGTGDFSREPGWNVNWHYSF